MSSTRTYVKASLLALLYFVASTAASRYKFDSHPCYRECTGEVNDRMTCGYNFTVENYWTSSEGACGGCPENLTDCFKMGCIPTNRKPRSVIVVNKMLPGPAIRVCEGDRIVVDVRNNLIGQDVSIHWRGILQRKTPWFDGVTGLTQCGIPSGTTFRYDFEVESAGTFTWEAFSDFQRSDGVYGSVIVRKSKKFERNAKFYDEDLAQHELVISDWLEGLGLPGFLTQQVDPETNTRPIDILVNGRGGVSMSHVDQSENTSFANNHAPPHELRVDQGKSYRFRVISQAVSDCPIEINVEGHSLLVIATDGNDVTPKFVSSIVIHSGERWDLVLQTRLAIGSYWINFRGLRDCNKLFQLAVLNYKPLPRGTLPDRKLPTWDERAELLEPNTPEFNILKLVRDEIKSSIIGLNDLDSLDDDVDLGQALPVDQFYLSVDFIDVQDLNFENSHHFNSQLTVRNGTKKLLPQMNSISNTIPTFTRSLTFASNVNDRSNATVTRNINFCNNTETSEGITTNCSTQYCQCTHGFQLKVNATVEIILVNRGVTFDSAPSFHLHGNKFRVMAIERWWVNRTVTIAGIKEMDKHGQIHRHQKVAPLKDTAVVPPNGFTILRFRPTTPGFWLLRASTRFIGEVGMSVIFKVGTDDSIAIPPKDFPTCETFQPQTDSQITWDTGVKFIQEPTTTTTKTELTSTLQSNLSSSTTKNTNTGSMTRGSANANKNSATSVLLSFKTLIFFIIPIVINNN